MKSKDFAVILQRFAKLLLVADADITEDRILQLSALFEVAPAASVVEVVKKMREANLESPRSAYRRRTCVHILAELRNFLTGPGKGVAAG